MSATKIVDGVRVAIRMLEEGGWDRQPGSRAGPRLHSAYGALKLLRSLVQELPSLGTETRMDVLEIRMAHLERRFESHFHRGSPTSSTVRVVPESG